MNDNDFHSLNKGVFVVPYDSSQSEPETSSAAPLRELYSIAYDDYVASESEYEAERSSGQLDRISHWLDQSEAAAPLWQAFPIHRLPLAVIQGTSSGIATQLPKRTRYVSVINGRDVGDIATATRLAAVGFLGEAALEAKKAGRTPIDEVERWWRKLRDRPSLLVYIEQAQAIAPTVLGELIYIFNLHSDVPFRLLLSVPSASTFLSSTAFLEPSEVDMSVLAPKTGRSDGSVAAVLQAACGAETATPLVMSNEVARDLKTESRLLGGGPTPVLKTLQWLLLRHRHASALAWLSDSTEDESSATLRLLKSAVASMRNDENDLGPALFEVESSPDMTANPAPRLSILQALRNPESFLGTIVSTTAEGAASQDVESDTAPLSTADDSVEASPLRTSQRVDGRVKDYVKMSGKTTRQKRWAATPEASKSLTAVAGKNESADGPFKEIEALHTLWQSAGKSINLWDWLDGFRTTLQTSDSDLSEGHFEDTPTKRKRRQDDEDDDDDKELDSEEQIRVHARFIRYVEEARMMGLVRARGRGRGRGKGSDEVAKGVLL